MYIASECIDAVKEFKYRAVYDIRTLNAKLFLSIFIIGILFRLVAFGSHTSLHPDEALYANWSASIGHNFKLGLTVREVDKPPLFYYLVGASIFLFGPTDAAIKLPGLCIGILMIPLVCLIALNLARQHAALWAGFFYALSPFEILYAPTAFADTTCMFLSLLALLAILYRIPLMTGIFLGLALSTKQSVVFLTPLYVLFFIMRTKYYTPSLIKIIKGFAISIIPLILWMLLFADKGVGVMINIYQERFFTPTGNTLRLLVEWFKQERYFTGNFMTSLVAIGFVFLARLLYGFKLYRKRNIYDFRSFIEIFSLLIFVIAYDLLISMLNYPLYSRYLIVISSPFIILFALSLNIILKRVHAQLRIMNYRWDLTTLISAGIVAYWIITTPANMATFPDGANYRFSESIKPTADFIKNQPAPAMVFYTDDTWPWIGWYLFAEKESGNITRRPANFRSEEGIRQLLERLNKDTDKLEKHTLYFILNTSRDIHAYKLLSDVTGKDIAHRSLFISQAADSKHPSYQVDIIDKTAISEILSK
ncbi:MAG: glycosyltransferase family 39 protein [Candidatus Auribacterota bacterium]|jgi:4-amino-4-deoxy-L-arabinose transferase-like glycosyltransferase|nr:glycosyltransferase family 39 protein [Candidatus Auribacterota bacterium]